MEGKNGKFYSEEGIFTKTSTSVNQLGMLAEECLFTF